MEEDEQARAYSEADFEAPHDAFVDLAARAFPHGAVGRLLDLGCGPADITARFARRHPSCTLLGVDGSAAMLSYGLKRVAQLGLEDRIELRQVLLPTGDLGELFDGAISNSLLHHLEDPLVIWRSLRQHVRPGSPVFVMDLMRPDSVERATQLVETYSSGEPEVLRRDFYFSLLAAYRTDEIKSQLETCGLGHLEVQEVSDRHFVVFGLL
jgi:trans-aconitate methyltransferase